MLIKEISVGCSRSALSIKNGDVRINGSVAEYSCYSGYRLANERKQYCKKRVWSYYYYWDGQKPWCTRTYLHMSHKLFKALFFSTLKAAQFLLLLQMAELLRKKTKPYISATRAFLYWDQQIEQRATLFPADGGVLHQFVHPVKRWQTNDDCNVYS